MAAKKPTPKNATDEKSQKQRFIDFAREHGADETGDALDKAFKKMDPKAKD